MSRLFPSETSPKPEGTLIIDKDEYIRQVYYIPPSELLKSAKLDYTSPTDYKTLLMKLDLLNDFIEIFPISTLSSSRDFLEQKYRILQSITLVGFEFSDINNQEEIKYLLEELPSGFIKDFDYGLGLIKEILPLIHTLEDLNLSHLVIKNSELEKVEIDEDASCCILSYAQYETIRKHLGTIVRNARSASLVIRRAVAHNTLAYFIDDEKYPQKPLDIKNTPLARLIAKDSDNVEVDLSQEEQNITLSILDKNTKRISKEQPEKLLKLKEDIELVTLEQLIEKYEEMLSKKLTESLWQNLFNENPFILNMAFGCPIVKIQEFASVGGRKISGTGDKITDFLTKNSITNNTAIIEIKTPQESLVGKKYRGGVFSPSNALSGSLNQVLDQKYQLQKNIAPLKEASRIYDIESYSIKCVLIIGTTPQNLDEQKSFEFFRSNSKDVEIITFNELLEKLKLLHNLLSTSS